MNNDYRQQVSTAIYKADALLIRNGTLCYQDSTTLNQHSLNHCQSWIQNSQSCQIITQLKAEPLLVVNSRRRNGLILYKPYYAEFAGPGAAVGGDFDHNCQQAIAVGNLSLVQPESTEERQRAYLIRRQWIRLTKQITDNQAPIQRAQMILNQFAGFFDAQTVAQIPDEAFALMVGVLPQTIRKVRRTISDSD